MAATSWSANYQISTDATFRALFAPLSAFLATAGWTLVTSVFASGTNWTDVTAPAADTTARVTEIWAMGDSLQSTVPLYLKLEYGRGSTTQPSMQFTIGTGVSSTTITGMLYTGGWQGAGAAITTPVDHYASGTSSRICFALNVHGTSSGGSGQDLGLTIERRKKNDGTDDNTGFLINQWQGNTNNTFSLATTATVAGPGSLPIYVAYAGSAGGNLTFGGDVAIAPQFHCLGPSEIGMNMVGFPTGSWSAGQTFTATLFGVSVTYLALAVNPVPKEPTTQALCRMAMRYD